MKRAIFPGTFDPFTLGHLDILNRSKISNLVMTNNPLDLEEWKLFEKKDWNSDVYLASLRLDDILLAPNK